MAGLKVCGVTRGEDLELCDSLGVEAVGLNFWPGSKRGLTPAAAHELLRGRPAVAQRVGVFVDAEPPRVAELAAQLRLDLIQPHGDAPVQPFAELGLPWVWVIRGTPALCGLRVPTPIPTWILLDAAVAGYGGEGKRTDWVWAAAAVRTLAPLPVWLAGGIDPDNVREALQHVQPAGVDVASGTERVGAATGEKDPERVRALLAETRAHRACSGEQHH